MSPTPDVLAAQIAALGSADADERAGALAALVTAGESATNALIVALAGTDEQVRGLSARALAEIGDPAAEPAFRELLDDPDAAVRARGAQGLHRIDAPGALDALAGTIDELPNLLHYPFTVAVRALVARGMPAAAVVLPLLGSTNPATRERAVLVLRLLADRDDAPGGLGPAAAGYDPAAAESERDAAAARVAEVLAG